MQKKGRTLYVPLFSALVINTVNSLEQLTMIPLKQKEKDGFVSFTAPISEGGTL